MKQLHLQYLALLAVLLLAADFQRADLSIVQEGDLEGKWRSLTANGGAWNNFQWEFTGSRFVISDRNRTAHTGTFLTQASHKPAYIDIQYGGGTMCGIYQISGDQLTICVVYNSNQRPTGFDTGATVLVFQRGPLR